MKKLGAYQALQWRPLLLQVFLNAVAAPLLAKLLRIKNPVGIGVGLGCSCHAIGTAKALELGEIQGAMSSIALGGSRYDDRYYFPIFYKLGV